VALISDKGMMYIMGLIDMGNNGVFFEMKHQEKVLNSESDMGNADIRFNGNDIIIISGSKAQWIGIKQQVQGSKK